MLLSSASSKTLPGQAVTALPVCDDDSLGSYAFALAAGYGLEADEDQADWVRGVMGRSGGRWVARTAGIDAPRQNGKNGGIEIRELAGLILLGEHILHTAHEVKTARKAFGRLRYFLGEKVNDENARFPELNALVKAIRHVNGQEMIELTTGGLWELSARSAGAGRGFDGIDLLVLDEAQELTDAELAALRPTILAARLGMPQVIYAGSAPDPEKAHLAKGEPFRRLRAAAMKGPNVSRCYLGYGVPDGPLPDIHDDAVIQAVNFGLKSGRISWETIADARVEMSPEQFAREHMGWWGDPESAALRKGVDLRAWALLADKTAPEPLEAVVVLDVAPNGRHASIGVAGELPDGRILLMEHTAGGTAWVVPRLQRILAKRQVLEVALRTDASAAWTKTLEAPLIAAGVTFKALSGIDAAAGTAALIKAVDDQLVAHLDQDTLNAAIKNATTVPRGEGDVWNRKDRTVNISPVVACATALHRWGIRKPRRVPMASVV